MKRLCENRWNMKSLFFNIVLTVLVTALPLLAKTAVDFDPNLDFSRFKTFAFLGGVEHLVMLPVDRDLMDQRVHHSVTRELTKKGLREVQASENPDLAVRYWANTAREVNLSVLGNWGPYAPYINSYWAWVYNEVSAASAKEGCLIVDLIDPQSKNLVWRLYLMRRITEPDKEWKRADDELTKAFESFPPSAKEMGEKKKERDAHPAKPDAP
jgi:hypothetical protein